MITIYKYNLVSVIDLISGTKVTELLKLPTGARVLSIGVQRDNVCAWILLDNEAPTNNNVHVQFIGTGWPVRFPDDVPNPIFVDTISLYNGDFIYHVFMGEVNSNWNIPCETNTEESKVVDIESLEYELGKRESDY